MLRQILPNLFFFESQGIGSNVFLLKGKNPVLIDSSAQANSSALKSSLEKAGISPKKISIVLHTHGHADHFGGDFLFPNAKIFMHKFDAGFVNKKDFDFTAADFILTEHFPKITSFFKSNETINLGNFKLEVLFTPGHTKGSVCFFEKSLGLLFSGDTLFLNGFGRTDLPSGNSSELMASLEKISKLDFNFLLPGHGSILQGSQKQNIQESLEALGKAFL